MSVALGTERADPGVVVFGVAPSLAKAIALRRGRKVRAR